MYGDIIPPKKKYHEETHIEDHYVVDKELTGEPNRSVRFTPIKRAAYQEPKSKKLPIVLALLALLVIGFGIYHKVFNGTVFTIVPKTTRIDIQQKIPLILQNREKDSLTYSLVYVPEGEGSRNPFAATVGNNATSTPSNNSSEGAALTMTATSTGLVKKIKLINNTAEVIPLRISTRFDVRGVTYTLDAATDVPPTPKAEVDAVSTGTPTYKVIGFKDTSSYDTVYAIDVKNNAPSSSVVTESNSTSSLPPQDILSLMPEDALPLQKSTIYDKILDQSAIVVFDERVLQDYLNATNIQSQEYFKAFKPFGSSVTYSITIADYTLNTSVETGKPVSFSNLTLDITPVIDPEFVPMQFAGFKKETMEKIEKQVSEFITLTTSYTPFWSKSVAEEKRIDVK